MEDMYMLYMQVSGGVWITGSQERIGMGIYSWRVAGKTTGHRPCTSNTVL